MSDDDVQDALRIARAQRGATPRESDVQAVPYARSVPSMARDVAQMATNIAVPTNVQLLARSAAGDSSVVTGKNFLPTDIAEMKRQVAAQKSKNKFMEDIKSGEFERMTPEVYHQEGRDQPPYTPEEAASIRAVFPDAQTRAVPYDAWRNQRLKELASFDKTRGRTSVSDYQGTTSGLDTANLPTTAQRSYFDPEYRVATTLGRYKAFDTPQGTIVLDKYNFDRYGTGGSHQDLPLSEMYNMPVGVLDSLMKHHRSKVEKPVAINLDDPYGNYVYTGKEITTPGSTAGMGLPAHPETSHTTPRNVVLPPRRPEEYADGGSVKDEAVDDAVRLAHRRPAYSSSIFPVTADDEGLHFDSNAGILGKVKQAGHYFADTMSGRKQMDVTDPEAIDAANTIAGMTTLGAGAMRAPANALRSGAAREETARIPSSYRVDNPGGMWLADKQEDAFRGTTGTARRGLRGSATAFAGMGDEPMMLPVSELAKLRGVNNERRVPGDFQYDDLAKDVADRGYTNESPVMVFVNHLGQPYVNEGNTRIAVAKDKGIPAIRSWVHWYNGGEDAPGNWTPRSVAEMERRVREGRAHGGRTPAWQRSAGKDPEGGLNAKGRAAYNRENPGKPGLKPPAPHPKTDRDAARRDSFCARMKGMKAKLTGSKTANDPDSRINKSLRAWNCRADGGRLMHDDTLYALRLAQQGRQHFDDGGSAQQPQTQSMQRSSQPFDLHSFVNNLYQQEFGREADEGGREYWEGQLGNGAITPDQMRNQFRGSQEYNSDAAQQYRAAHQPMAPYDTPYAGPWGDDQGLGPNDGPIGMPNPIGQMPPYGAGGRPPMPPQGGGMPFQGGGMPPQGGPRPMPFGGNPFAGLPQIGPQGGPQQPLAPWNVNNPTGGGPNDQTPFTPGQGGPMVGGMPGQGGMPFVGKNGGGGGLGGGMPNQGGSTMGGTPGANQGIAANGGGLNGALGGIGGALGGLGGLGGFGGGFM